MTRAICDGLQVIEMGAGSIGASFAGMVLADNGARVLKVEPPEGDRLRHQHPAGFLVWNRGKESLVADLRTDEGRGTRARAREPGRRGHRRVRCRGRRRLGPRRRAPPHGQPRPRVLLGEGLRLDRRVRHDPRVRGHRGGQGRRLQPGTVRLPVRPDLRQRAPGQRRRGAHGVQRRARRAHRARDDRAGPARRGHDAAGLQPARLLRHHDLAAHAAHDRHRARHVGGGCADGREPLQLLRADPGRALGDLHPDAPAPGPRAQPGRGHGAHHRRSALRQAASVRHRRGCPGVGGPALGGDGGAPVRVLGEGLPGRPGHRVRARPVQRRGPRPPADPPQRRGHHRERPGAGARRADRSDRPLRRHTVADRSPRTPARRARRATSPSCHRVHRPTARRHGTRSTASRSSSSGTSTPCRTGSRWPARSAPG